MKTAEKKKVVLFSQSERINHALFLYSGFLGESGLASGQTGIVLYMYYFSRYTQDSLCAKFAEELLNDISDNLYIGMPVDFLKGTTGIGWAIDHLIQNGFIEEDRDEILSAFDDIIEKQLYIITGTLSIWTGALIYYTTRIKGNGHRDSQIMNRLKQGRDRAIYEILHIIQKESIQPPKEEFDFTYPYIWVLYSLENIIDKNDRTNPAVILYEIIHKELETLTTDSLSSYNKWLLCQALHLKDNNILSIPDSFVIKNGRAGIVLATLIFSSVQNVDFYKKDLFKSIDINNRYAGYPLSDNLLESEKLGLLNGIAGIGFALLIQKYINKNN